MWVEFVSFGSCLAPKVFFLSFSVFLPLQKTTSPNSNSTRIETGPALKPSIDDVASYADVLRNAC